LRIASKSLLELAAQNIASAQERQSQDTTAATACQRSVPFGTNDRVAINPTNNRRLANCRVPKNYYDSEEIDK
jgi:hypothetical protein